MILRRSDCFSTLCSRLVCSPVTEVHRIRLDSAIILSVLLIIRANTGEAQCAEYAPSCDCRWYNTRSHHIAE